MNEPIRNLFVISDLHLGGKPPLPGAADSRGFRLCTQVDALANFVGLVADRPPGAGTELVINGDFVDFLAHQHEDGAKWRPFLPDSETALSVLQDIVRNNSAVFNQLSRLLS